MAEPLPVAYLNGEFLPLREARISPLDRGFLFADGAYEVIPVFGGRPFRYGPHFARLARSLEALRMRDPLEEGAWRTLCRELIGRNGGGDMYLYVQVTRGAEYGRNHAPLPEIERTVFAYAAPLPRPGATQLAQGAACITAEDTRWARCDIKSIALLPNVLLRQLSIDAGASETILLRDGWLMEASSSTVHVVVNGEVLTPPNSSRILPGTTRSVVEELLLGLGIPHRTVAVAEATLRAADEVWLASATRDVSSVTQLDGRPVGSGLPGPVWQRTWRAFQDLIKRLAGTPW
ncbi:MAG: D-amino acid aminotransferase [Luteimonas sp.]|nr:D-amino acid aminotransferase [Luteimonas sp.]